MIGNYIKKAIFYSFYKFKELKYKYYSSRRVPTKKQQSKANQIRRKNKITVAFIIYDITKWRSEDLYLRMVEHPRFDPVLVPVFAYLDHGNYSLIVKQFNDCIKYLQSKSYPYVIGQWDKSIDDLVNPDIVFYGEHYSNLFDSGYTIELGTSRNSLSCYIPYSMLNTKLVNTNNQVQGNLAWMTFVENQFCKEDLKDIVYNKGRNKMVTGIPIQDSFLRVGKFKDVWKPQEKKKKRIIWAPSHTIKVQGVYNAYNQSSFLKFADRMLLLAKKYQDTVQWAFKPHPSLKRKLIVAWGEEKTNEYYSLWAKMPNTQLEEGQYIDLFMTSDALIHDCMSFIVEYMFTSNPILFIGEKEQESPVFNTQTSCALNLHYSGHSIDDIEEFIVQKVINSNDPLRDARIGYKNKFLLPPNGKSACDNIINAILGEEEYKKYR